MTCSISSVIGASPSATRSSSATTCCCVVARASSLMSCAKPWSTAPSPPRDDEVAADAQRLDLAVGLRHVMAEVERLAGGDRPAALVADRLRQLALARRVHAGELEQLRRLDGDARLRPDDPPAHARHPLRVGQRALALAQRGVRARVLGHVDGQHGGQPPAAVLERPRRRDEAATAGPVQLAVRDRPAAGQHLARELRYARHAGQRGGGEHRLAVGRDEREADRRTGRQTLDERGGRELLLRGHGQVLPRHNAWRGPPRDTWRAGRRGRARADRRLPRAGQALASRPGRGRGGGAADGRDQRRLRPVAGRHRPRPRRARPAQRRGGRGSWLPEPIRRALGPELLDALAQAEAVRLVTPASTWASPRAVLAVTERRLLWLLDDAPVGRVRSLAFRDVATVSLRVRRRGATLSLRTTGGRRYSFADLRPPTAAVIERHLREAL